MTAAVVFLLSLFTAVKTAAYGIWELKKSNKSGGFFVLIIAAFALLAATRYLMKYWA